MDLKEAVGELKTKLIIAIQKTTDYGATTDWDNDIRLYQFVISKLSLLEQVEKGEVKKKTHQGKQNNSRFNKRIDGFNEAIDLCNAEWAKKLDAEEIERIVISCKKQTEASCPHCNKNSTWTQINSYELSQAIITHLTKNDS